MKRYIIGCLFSIACTGLYAQTPMLGESSVEDVINAMTLEEKAHLLIGTGMDGYEDNETTVIGATKLIVPGAAGTTYPIPRLGIPAIVLADGPAGLRIDATRQGTDSTFYCTHFPVETLLSSTWNTALVENMCKAMGNEVLEYGVDVLLSPALNIQRNPLNGRNFEYFSEDPVVSGLMAAAYVNGIQKNGVGTSIKHFAANNQETNRNNNDARISQRALREIYLKGFEIAAKESNPWTVMSSYNLINGNYTSQDKELLTTILRDEWGYGGLVMTDWFGGDNAPLQIEAGNDLLQPGYKKQYDDLVEAMKTGKLSEEDVNRDLKRILELIMLSPRFKGYNYSYNPDLNQHAEVAREAAVEGMVLLENKNNTLPISSGNKNIALFGCEAYNMIPGGSGSGNVNRAYTVSLVEGLEGAGYSIDRNLKQIYDVHLKSEEERLRPETIEWWTLFFDFRLPEEIRVDNNIIQKAVADNDLAIVTLGRKSGESADRPSSDFDLSETERALLQDVADAFHSQNKPVVVILNIGGSMETASWKNIPDAILCAWQPGQEGGNAIADILSGKVNPSGKLPMTFPINLADHYSSKNFPIDMNPDLNKTEEYKQTKGTNKDYDYTDYEEDIYVGYRYFDSFYKDVSYPFGYGLSYTTFEYGEPSVENKDNTYLVTVPVKNTGNEAGKEVVQVYIADQLASMRNKPAKELKAFAKTSELKPGETAILKFSIPASELASFDEATSSWVVKPGDYEILIGSSSRDIKSNIPVVAAEYSKPVNNVMRTPENLRCILRQQN